MSPDEITRLARLHLVVNDDWQIFGLEAFARAIEQAATRKAIEQCASMVEMYLADHRIEQARECLPDAIRAILPDSKGEA